MYHLQGTIGLRSADYLVSGLWGVMCSYTWPNSQKCRNPNNYLYSSRSN